MSKKAPIAKVTNAELWNLARQYSPKFASHTAEGTSDIFTEKGFEALKRSDIDAINEFFEISLRVAFQKIDVSRARNVFENSGLLEYYDTPNGGYVQRIAVNSIKPVSPAYHGLKDGDTVDPFIVRKPDTNERFFQQNFDYQSWITLQEFQVKQIFIAEYGMGEYIAGIMQGLRNGYTIQESLNIKEALNAAINSANYPLQDGQIVEIAWGTGTDGAIENSDLMDFISNVKDTATIMQTTEQTGAFNANGFETVVDIDDYVLLTRAGVKNKIQLQLEVGAFNPDRLTLPFSTFEVSDFGGLTAQNANSQDLTKIYTTYGEMIGYVDPSITTSGDPYKKSDGNWYIAVVDEILTEVEITKPTAVENWYDPNADVIAVLAQKGLVFENIQNPYEVVPIFNPRGLYTNYWASSPNNAIVTDSNYNMVVFKKASV